jgi:sugar phosphate isomerase/epimerase
MSFIGRKWMVFSLKLILRRHTDNVKAPFLQEASHMKGFVPLWCKLVERFVKEGSVEIKVDYDIGHYF